MSNIIDPRRGESTRLAYTLEKSGRVTILVADLDGDIISVLQRGTQPAGDHAVSWDGRNRSGRPAAPGVYHIKIVGPGINEVRKILLVRNR
jgi:flagellar hook assembly protein FlgD